MSLEAICFVLAKRVMVDLAKWPQLFGAVVVVWDCGRQAGRDAARGRMAA